MTIKRRPRVSVVVTVPPAMQDADLLPLAGQTEAASGKVDEIIWVTRRDGAGRPASPRTIAAASIMPEVPATEGRGDAMWRGLAATAGEIVVWLDAAGTQPSAIGPIIDSLDQGSADLVLGPVSGPSDHAIGELLARPLLTMLFPELGSLVWPSTRAIGGRRRLLERLPFFTGEGAEIGLVLDTLLLEGRSAIAEAQVGGLSGGPVVIDAVRATEVAQAILRRAEEAGRIRASIDYPTHPLLIPGSGTLDAKVIRQIDRPPIEVAPTYLAALRDGAVAAAR